MLDVYVFILAQLIDYRQCWWQYHGNRTINLLLVDPLTDIQV